MLLSGLREYCQDSVDAMVEQYKESKKNAIKTNKTSQQVVFKSLNHVTDK